MLVNGGQVIGDPHITRWRWKFNAVILDTPNGLEQNKVGALDFFNSKIFWDDKLKPTVFAIWCLGSYVR